MPLEVAGHQFPIGPSTRTELVNIYARHEIDAGPGVYVVVYQAGTREGQPVWRATQCGQDGESVVSHIAELPYVPEGSLLAVRIERDPRLRAQIASDVQAAIAAQV